MMEKVAPYKAAKIDLLGMEKLKDAPMEDDVFKPIPRQEVNNTSEPKVENKTDDNNSNNSLFVE